MTLEKEKVKKVLAIAIMQNGIVVNKLIPGRESVRIGTGYNNNIVVEGTSLPDSMLFITPGEDAETWILRLSDSMDASIESGDGEILKFADLRDLGIFPVDPEGLYLLNIKYLDQGQIKVGPFLIHFGFIVPPEKPKDKQKEKKEKKPRATKVEQKEKEKEKEKPDNRVLKIIIENPDGKKELIPNAGLMTVGEAEYNTVITKNIGLPRIHTLLEPHNNKYLLRLIPGIKGGVEVKGSVIPFHTLIERNLMQKEKQEDSYIWVFDKNVSGVFTFGNTEVFFSFVEPSKTVRKPEFQAEVPRKKYISPEYDWDNFASRPHDGLAMKGNREESNRISVVFGLGLAIALLTGSVFDRFITVIRETKEQKLRRAPTARVATLASQTRQSEGVGEEIISDMNIGEETVEVGTGGGGEASGGGDGQSSGVSDGAAAGEAVLQSIGFAAYGTGGSGGSAGIASDLQSAAASGAGLASGGGGEAVIAGAGGGGSGGIGGLMGGGGGPSASIEGVSSSEVEAVHRAAEVTFSTHSSSSEIGVQGRSMSDIRRKINMINMRVKRVYEDLLRNNPSAGGTINISFSITPSGSVIGISVSASGSLTSLEPSVRAAVQSLSFGVSSEQTADIPMSVPMNLVPPE